MVNLAYFAEQIDFLDSVLVVESLEEANLVGCWQTFLAQVVVVENLPSADDAGEFVDSQLLVDNFAENFALVGNLVVDSLNSGIPAAKSGFVKWEVLLDGFAQLVAFQSVLKSL